jgi:hypothetical protein
MKTTRFRLLLLMFVGHFLLQTSQSVTLPFYDGFVYTNMALGLDDSGTETIWSEGNSPSVASPVVTNVAALSYAGLPEATGHGIYLRYPGGTSKESGVDTASYPMTGAGQTLYASFLLNLQSYPTDNCPLAYFDDNASPSGSFQGVGISSDGRLTLHRNAGINSPGGTSTIALNLNTTYLVVFRYKSVTNASNDELALWINAPLGQPAETTPDLVMASGGSDRTALRGFFLKQDTTFTAQAYFDEIRLGTNWTDVTAGVSTPVITPVPVITQAMLGTQGLILRGTNGPVSGVYQVLTSTNATLAAANWPTLAFHSFDASGNFDSTNPIAPGASQQFFRLLVGGTIPIPPAAPLITNQPQSLTVTAGVTTNFLVGATGTAPFAYVWLFNTNTPVGSNSNRLTLANVQQDNTGSYQVIVSNNVGSVTSVVATLTVNPAPPFVITPPQNHTVVVSNIASFSVVAGGSAPLTYQWYFNTNTILPGATNTSFSIASAQTTDAGGYSVVISNSVGSVTSVVATLNVLGLPEGGGNIYVATNGLEANPGTPAQPTTLPKALTLVQPGGTIYLRGGTYSYSTQITINHGNNGVGDVLRKRLFAYPAEHPVLDFSSQPYGDTSDVSNPRGIQINGHWWHLRGLEVMGSTDNGIYVAGNSNIVERCITHHNRDSGIQIARHSSTAPRAEWPAYNLILNCDSYDNYDSPPNGGENADGFACKLTSGPGNVFRGCVARNNIDDGWDLFTKSDTGAIDPVVIDQCIAYANGVLSDGTENENGDRNGFKLGGSDIAVNHIVTRSIAFNNGKNGFTWNSNPGEIRMVNNFAFNNVQGNYKFDRPGPIFINNLSLWQTSGTGVNDRYGGSSGIATGSNNVFWFNKVPRNDAGLSVSSASFQSLTAPPGGFARHADGSLNLGGFAKLIATSPLIEAGDVPVLPIPGELPFDPATAYLGDPDIGAVESGPQ